MKKIELKTTADGKYKVVVYGEAGTYETIFFALEREAKEYYELVLKEQKEAALDK